MENGLVSSQRIVNFRLNDKQGQWLGLATQCVVSLHPKDKTLPE